jgi:hypothetical protein
VKLSNQPEVGLVELPRIEDERGTLSYVQSGCHLPFAIERVFYLYNVPEGAERGGHALRECQQVLIALSGSLEIATFDGKATQRFQLSRPNQGLYVPPMVWRELSHFSPGAVCLVLASKGYLESDYFRDLQSFLAAVSNTK